MRHAAIGLACVLLQLTYAASVAQLETAAADGFCAPRIAGSKRLERCRRARVFCRG
jgi:hypothetical protein